MFPFISLFRSVLNWFIRFKDDFLRTRRQFKVAAALVLSTVFAHALLVETVEVTIWV